MKNVMSATYVRIARRTARSIVKCVRSMLMISATDVIHAVTVSRRKAFIVMTVVSVC